MTLPCFDGPYISRLTLSLGHRFPQGRSEAYSIACLLSAEPLSWLYHSKFIELVNSGWPSCSSFLTGDYEQL